MPAVAASVPLARHRVVSLLRSDDWDDDRIDEAALMTTELATNAVEHARTPFTLTAELVVHRLRVDVRDACTAPPVHDLVASPVALGGRGLAMVAALADRWGHRQFADGKSVWFEAEPRPR